jgi:ParB/RepB/Spo0J family partition protein
MKIEDIEVKSIDMSKNFKRFQGLKDENFKDELAALKMNIEAIGLISPIAVQPNGKRYTVVSGNRRLAAHIMMDCKTIPCHVMAGEEFEISISDNMQRLDLTPIERGCWLRDYINQAIKNTPYKDSKTPKDDLYKILATRLGKAQRTLMEWVSKASGDDDKHNPRHAGRKSGSQSTEEKAKNTRKALITAIPKIGEHIKTYAKIKAQYASDATFLKLVAQFKQLVTSM